MIKSGARIWVEMKIGQKIEELLRSIGSSDGGKSDYPAMGNYNGVQELPNGQVIYK